MVKSGEQLNIFSLLVPLHFAILLTVLGAGGIRSKIPENTQPCVVSRLDTPWTLITKAEI